jgi:hypothetical protein
LFYTNNDRYTIKEKNQLISKNPVLQYILTGSKFSKNGTFRPNISNPELKFLIEPAPTAGFVIYRFLIINPEPILQAIYRSD